MKEASSPFQMHHSANWESGQASLREPRLPFWLFWPTWQMQTVSCSLQQDLQTWRREIATHFSSVEGQPKDIESRPALHVTQRLFARTIACPLWPSPHPNPNHGYWGGGQTQPVAGGNQLLTFFFFSFGCLCVFLARSHRHFCTHIADGWAVQVPPLVQMACWNNFNQ